MVHAIVKEPDLRLDLIGASDAPAILGLSPYAGPGDVWARIVHGVSSPAGEAAEWGTRIEPLVLAEFARRHGLRVAKPASVVQPKGRAWQRVSLDGLIEGRLEAVEIKCVGVSRAAELGPEGTDQVLEGHLVQVQAQMEALDLERCYVVYLVGGNSYREYTVERSGELGDLVREECERFWTDYVVPRKVPPAFGRLETVKRLFPSARTPARDVTDEESIAAIGRYMAARDARKAAEEEEAKARGWLCEIIGESTAIRTPDGREARWANVRRAGDADWREVAADLARQAGLGPEALDEIARRYPGKETNYRTLRVMMKKEGGR